MRRMLCAFLLALALLSLSVGSVSADEATTVTALETQCTAARDGSCTVTLNFTLRVGADSTEFSFPIAPDAEEIAVTGASRTVQRGEKYTIVTLTPLSAGTFELSVSYHLTQTVTDEGSAQSFRLVLLYPDWPCAIETYRLTLALPAEFETLPAFQSEYYGDLIENYMEVQIADGTVRAELNRTQTLRDHEGITVSLDLPANYFDLRFLAGKTVATDRLLFGMLLVLSLLYWLVFLRGRPVLPKRQAMPPEGGNAGEVSYVLCGRKPDLALMVVQWATLGYLTIHRSRKGRIWLTCEIDMGNERKAAEVAVFRALFSHGAQCDVRSAEYLRARQLAAERVTAYWKPRIFRGSGSTLLLRVIAAAAGLALCLACFDASVPPEHWRWFLIVPLTLLGGLACWLIQRLGGCLLRRHAVRTIALGLAGIVFLLIAGRQGGQGFLSFVCILFQLLIGFSVRCGGQRTRPGSAQASELLGFRRYLLSTPASAFRQLMLADPQYYYRNLPYAEALCIGRLFSGSFDRNRLDDCDWLDWEGKPRNTAAGFYARFSRLMLGLRGEREPLLLRMTKRARKGGRR